MERLETTSFSHTRVRECIDQQAVKSDTLALAAFPSEAALPEDFLLSMIFREQREMSVGRLMSSPVQKELV